MTEPVERDRQTATALFSVERHLESWASDNTPNDGWHMGRGFAISREKFEAIIAALTAARAEGRREERERCAKIAERISSSFSTVGLTDAKISGDEIAARIRSGE